MIILALTFHLFAIVQGSFHLYNTDVFDNHDYKDCLYSFMLNDTINEWQLIPYCIRHNIQSSDDVDDECNSDADYTFEQLKSKTVDSHQLYRWNAPIDTINNYQKYLTGHDLSLKNHHYCNCSTNLFGTQCQYSFDQVDETMTFDEIVISQFKRKQSLRYSYEIFNDMSMLTCYKGLQCHSIICLDWRQICDGTINCEKGEDEPDECIHFETNECGNDEYRCRHRACIPITFLIDFSYDCMDLSDENEINRELYGDPSCSFSPKLVCDFRLDHSHSFSCSDGESIEIDSSVASCNNGRDLFLRRNLLLSSLTNGNNISFECWFFMLCISDNQHIKLFNHINRTCECSYGSTNVSQCLKYFREHCPISFVFQTTWNVLYPFVWFLYHNVHNSSFKQLKPTHVCYNQSSCHNLPFAGLPLIDGLICIEIETEKGSIRLFKYLQKAFSACSFPYTSMLASDKRLFHCNKSMKFISKHRVGDLGFNCYYGEDHWSNVDPTVMHNLNLTYRFKCRVDDRWFSRSWIGNGQCNDMSDTLYIGGCRIASDIGCQFLRGSNIPRIDYVFQENCNNAVKLHRPIENETDETNCEEWPVIRCDGHWDTINGEDELNCSNTILSYITHAVLNCSVDEHYCAYSNGTMGCLAKKHAGDGRIDCLGATDERTTSCAFKEPSKPFYCPMTSCIEFLELEDCTGCTKLSHLCDNYPTCDYDELMCPWFKNFTCDKFQFVCKNGTCINENQKCDDIIDCQPDAEDEWFCDLKYRKISQFSFDNIDTYPSIIDSPGLTIVTTPQTAISLPVHDIVFKSVSLLKDWFCNRGIIVTKRSSRIECFCPPGYYGSRCEYQSERVLISVRIDTLASLSGHENQQNGIRLLSCLMLDDTVVHHEQILHVRLMKQIFYLNYPRPPPKQRGNWSVRLDAFSVTKSTVDFKASWFFNIPFSFLPVNRLVLHLTLDNQETCNILTCVHGSCRKYLNAPYREYCQCEENWSGVHCNVTTNCSCARGGLCVGRHPTPICICPLGHIGNECQASFDPCSNITCKHGGRCLPLDERQSIKFVCSCRSGYSGVYCEQIDAFVDIHFSNSLFSHSQSLSTAVFVHFLELQNDVPGILFVQNRLLYKQVQLNKVLRAFNNNQKYLPNFILLQIYFEPNNSVYYIAAIIKSQQTNITTTIYEWNRCPYADELLLNTTIQKFVHRKKVKYYRHACESNNTVKWFYDEAYLCFCYKDRRPDCVYFQHVSTQCKIDYCKNDGRCVQNNFNGVWDFGCVCSGCAYGPLCQLTTSQYALSLDMMLGQDILANVSLTDQPILIKIVLIIVVLMLSLAFISNLLSFVTFKQRKVLEFGCGLYLFCLPVVGQLGLSIFTGRFLYLLVTQIYSVSNQSAALWSCIGLEYFLSVCPMLFDWLTACIAFERSINIIKGISFNKANSVWWAKRVILLLTIVVLVSAWHEFFIHQLIDDPRAITRHTWCVIIFPWPWLQYYRLTINLINLFVPSIINLTATVFLLHKSTKMKQAFGKKKSEKSYFGRLKKQLPLYGSPLALVVLSLMRLIFSFTLVCIIHQWQKYVYLTAYLISFCPLMGTFPIFVLSAKIYKTEFIKFIQRTIRKTGIKQF